MRKNFLSKAAIILASALVLTACGASNGNEGGNATPTTATEEFGNTDYAAVTSYIDWAKVEAVPDNADAKTVTIAYGYSAYPIAYTTNNGGVSGYDIEVLKAVDALLPQYKFEFVPSAGGDDLLLGVQTGKTDGAVRNWFQTAQRREIFTFPEKNIGLSVTGLTVRKDDLANIYDFASLSKAGGRVVPVDPGDGHYTVLKTWCLNNPELSWEFETGQLANTADAYAWVAEGRYDAYFGLEVIFKSLVLGETGSAHQYADQLTWTPCAAIPTYVIFSGNDNGKEIAAAFDSVIDQIWESGYPNFLQKTLYGDDYIATYGRDGAGFNK